MSAVDNTPQNRNFLSPLNFQFQIQKAPNINFFIQKANVPSLQLQDSTTPNPFVRNPSPGDHINFGNLDITFKVDEDLQNYLEVYNWIKALGFNHDFGQYANIANQPVASGNGIYSDISLTILSSSKQPNYTITYIDAFPVTIGGFTMNTVDPNVNYIECSASFKYTYFNVERVGNNTVTVAGNTA